MEAPCEGANSMLGADHNKPDQFWSQPTSLQIILLFYNIIRLYTYMGHGNAHLDFYLVCFS